MPLYGLFCVKVLGGQIKVLLWLKKIQRERDRWREEARAGMKILGF